MKKFGLLILALLLTSFVSVGAVSAQQVIVKAPGWYAANYECTFYDSEGKHLTSDDFSGKLLVGWSDAKKTIPSDAATFTFYGKAVCGGSHTFNNIAIAGTTGDAIFDFNGLLGSSARIDYNIFGRVGSVSVN